MIYEQFNPIALTTTKNIFFTEHLPLAAFLISQSMKFLFTYLTNSKAPAGKLTESTIKVIVIFKQQHLPASISRSVSINQEVTQSFPYENNCQCYKKLASRSQPMLFTPTYFCSHTYSLLFCWEIKSCFDCCFPQQIRPQTTVP